MTDYSDDNKRKEVLEEVLGARQHRLNHWAGLRGRIGDIRALAVGQWGKVYKVNAQPEADALMPMVENFFRRSIEDGGAMFGRQNPTERVDPATLRDTKAEDREKVVNGYNGISEIYDSAEYFGQDFVAAGITAIRIWPDMGRPVNKRFPRFERLEPEMILPDPGFRPDRPVDNVMVQQRIGVGALMAQFPAEMAPIIRDIEAAGQEYRRQQALQGNLGWLRGKPLDFDVFDYYCSRYIARVICYDDPSKPSQKLGKLLVVMDNPTGLCHVQIAVRRTWAFEPLGALDDSKGIVRTMNRYMRLLTDYFVRMVYSGKLVWNVDNAREQGIGVIYRALGPDARMDNVVPEAPSLQVGQILGALEGSARSSMTRPRLREGDPSGLYKTTAAMFPAATAELRDFISSCANSFAVAKRRSNEVAMATDEWLCNTRKEITGKARGRRFRLLYTPKDLIAGDYQNRVEWGNRAGVDPQTWNVIAHQRLGRSWSLKTLLENDPDTEDVDAEIAQMDMEALKNALFAGLSDPTVPPHIKAQAYDELAKTKDPVKVAALLLEAGVQPAESAPGAEPNPFAPPGTPAQGAQQPQQMPDLNQIFAAQAAGRR